MRQCLLPHGFQFWSDLQFHGQGYHASYSYGDLFLAESLSTGFLVDDRHRRVLDHWCLLLLFWDYSQAKVIPAVQRCGTARPLSPERDHKVCPVLTLSVHPLESLIVPTENGICCTDLEPTTLLAGSSKTDPLPGCRGGPQRRSSWSATATSNVMPNYRNLALAQPPDPRLAGVKEAAERARLAVHHVS